MSHGMKIRSLCTVLAALTLSLCLGPAAQSGELTAEEKAAIEELHSMLDINPRPEDPAELAAKFKEILPKIEAFAEKNAKNEAGVLALFSAAQLATDVKEPDKARAALTKLIERYPHHLLVGDAKALLAKLPQAKPDKPEAADFTTTDLTGKALKLSGFRGKVVLLDFFAGWCPPCRAEMPNLKALYAKYKDRGFEIVGVSLDKTLDAATAYVTKEGITWTVGWQAPGGWDNPVAKLYQIRSIPATRLLDKEGKIIGSGLRGKALNAALEKIFPDEKPPENPPENPKAKE